MSLTPPVAPKKTSNNFNSQETSLKMMTVVKRSGVIVPFHADRITSAIVGAVRDSFQINKGEELSEEHKDLTQTLTTLIVDELWKRFKKGNSLTVEGIQDIVEQKLMDEGYHHVARDYIIYRDKHKQLRDNKEVFPQVLRSDQKTIVRFNPIKIASTLEHAFRETLNIEEATPADIFETVNELTQTILRNLIDQNTGIPISTADIQEEIENELMAYGYFKIAKHLILRQGHKKASTLTATQAPGETTSSQATFSIKPFLQEIFTFATKGFKVDKEALIQRTLPLTFKGITQKEGYAAAILAVKEKIEFEPDYALIGARVLLDGIYRETLSKPALPKTLKKSTTAILLNTSNQQVKKTLG